MLVEELCEAASMRPRHICLGYGLMVWQRLNEVLASMRPRHICLGYVIAETLSQCNEVLLQ